MSYERNAVGIDVSNGRSTVSVLRPFGEVVLLPFEVKHTTEELSALADKLTAINGETRVVMEHTGRYYESIEKVLHEKGLFVSSVNPLLIKQYGNNSLRNVKTDKADSMKIARYALDNWADLRDYTPMDKIRYDLKTLHRQFNLASKQKTATNNNLVSLTEQVFPGIRKIFESPVRRDGTQKWVDFIFTFWHADCVRKHSLKAFTERYQKWCKRKGYHFSAEKALDVYAGSCGHFTTLPKNDNTKLLITTAAQQLLAGKMTLAALRAEMTHLAKQLPEYDTVRAMYGVGETTAAQLMAEIGDVRRFPRRSSIVGFAGVDPAVDQSGKHEAKSTPTTKRGSPHLRKTLYQIVCTYLKRSPVDEPVYQFLDKKRSEGKPYFVYMTAAQNKFLRIYYARVKECLEAFDAQQGTSQG